MTAESRSAPAPIPAQGPDPNPASTSDRAPAPVPGSASAPVSSSSPGPTALIRYRCAACGNLTRFDVVTQRRTRAFHHYSVGGDLAIEDVEVLDESVEEVSCRWCGHGDAIEVLADDAPPGD